ncbi:bifunctional phosphoserine phosphatase/homoserine phosphotransferase ThrH [Candidatus Sumerlaeota bacterium]|nr:bifunctional phosphoserine phosphatase/homoserine phosphotransferase ThrH [Candidatus Sumerlaeota bacterium]
MKHKLTVVAADLEGVFTPEVWIAVAEKTAIERLRLTTRDVPDYDVLMRGRLQILREHGLKLSDVQAVIQTLQPLPGAIDFVNWVRSRTQLIVLSDTYAEFASPLMAKLGFPTLFCNWLEVDAEGNIVGYHIRKRDGKKAAVVALRDLGFHVIAIGDSYNDTTMLAEADAGLLFRPPANVAAEFPQFKVTTEYGELREQIEGLL